MFNFYAIGWLKEVKEREEDLGACPTKEGWSHFGGYRRVFSLVTSIPWLESLSFPLTGKKRIESPRFFRGFFFGSFLLFLLDCLILRRKKGDNDG